MAGSGFTWKAIDAKMANHKAKDGESGAERMGLDQGLQSAVCDRDAGKALSSSDESAAPVVSGEPPVSGGRPRKPVGDEKTEKRRAFRREYQNTWMRTRREEWLAGHGPCQQCGSMRDLQVDHKEPGQKIAHRVWSWSQARLTAELAKCQALCRRCHERKTALEFSALSPERIVALRVEYQAGVKPDRQLAREYGVNHKTVKRIGTGERFGWLTPAFFGSALSLFTRVGNPYVAAGCAR